MEGAKIAVI